MPSTWKLGLFNLTCCWSLQTKVPHRSASHHIAWTARGLESWPLSLGKWPKDSVPLVNSHLEGCNEGCRTRHMPWGIGCVCLPLGQGLPVSCLLELQKVPLLDEQAKNFILHYNLGTHENLRPHIPKKWSLWSTMHHMSKHRLHLYAISLAF